MLGALPNNWFANLKSRLKIIYTTQRFYYYIMKLTMILCLGKVAELTQIQPTQYEPVEWSNHVLNKQVYQTTHTFTAALSVNSPTSLSLWYSALLMLSSILDKTRCTETGDMEYTCINQYYVYGSMHKL